MAGSCVLVLRRPVLRQCRAASGQRGHGRAFQSPFAKPPGQGLSSATVNVLWGAFNLAAGYGLILQVGAFDLRNPWDAGASGLGALLISLFAARHFGRFHGGTDPKG